MPVQIPVSYAGVILLAFGLALTFYMPYSVRNGTIRKRAAAPLWRDNPHPVTAILVRAVVAVIASPALIACG